MTYPKPESAKESRQRLPAKAPYRAPSSRFSVVCAAPPGVRAAWGRWGARHDDGRSDRRAKEDIVRIGQHPLGLGIYVFRYKAPYSEHYGNHRRVGVMADEVAEKYPDAVSRHEDGYLMVDYGRLFH